MSEPATPLSPALRSLAELLARRALEKLRDRKAESATHPQPATNSK